MAECDANEIFNVYYIKQGLPWIFCNLLNEKVYLLFYCRYYYIFLILHTFLETGESRLAKQKLLFLSIRSINGIFS